MAYPFQRTHELPPQAHPVLSEAWPSETIQPQEAADDLRWLFLGELIQEADPNQDFPTRLSKTLYFPNQYQELQDLCFNLPIPPVEIFRLPSGRNVLKIRLKRRDDKLLYNFIKLVFGQL